MQRANHIKTLSIMVLLSCASQGLAMRQEDIDALPSRPPSGIDLRQLPTGRLERDPLKWRLIRNRPLEQLFNHESAKPRGEKPKRIIFPQATDYKAPAGGAKPSERYWQLPSDCPLEELFYYEQLAPKYEEKKRICLEILEKNRRERRIERERRPILEWFERGLCPTTVAQDEEQDQSYVSYIDHLMRIESHERKRQHLLELGVLASRASNADPAHPNESCDFTNYNAMAVWVRERGILMSPGQVLAFANEQLNQFVLASADAQKVIYDDCFFCLEELRERVVSVSRCGHKTHGHCLAVIKSKFIECPVCKTNIE
jgi:hypothetical protein